MISAKKKRKRAIAACTSCRKRKVRCDGNMPCGHCQSRGEECMFTQPKRRGKKSPRVYDETETAHLAALTAEPDAGLGYTADYYLNVYFEKSNPLTNLLRPDAFADGHETPVRSLQKTAALAIASNGCGHFAVATNLEREMRAMAGDTFDEFSPDGAVAFCLLSRFYWGVDPKRAQHYMKVSASMAEISEVAERQPALAASLRALAQEELSGRELRPANFVVPRNKTDIPPPDPQCLMPLVEDVCTIPPLADITPPMDENARMNARMEVIQYWNVLRYPYLELIRDFPRKNPFLRIFSSVDGFAAAEPREPAFGQVMCLNKPNFLAILELHQRAYRSFPLYAPLGPATAVFHAFLLSLESLLYLAIGATSKAFETVVASLAKTTQAAVELPFNGRVGLRALTMQAAVLYELEQWEHLDRTATLTQLLVPYFPAVATRISKQMQRTVESRMSDSGEDEESDEESDQPAPSAPPIPTRAYGAPPAHPHAATMPMPVHSRAVATHAGFAAGFKPEYFQDDHDVNGVEATAAVVGGNGAYGYPMSRGGPDQSDGGGAMLMMPTMAPPAHPGPRSHFVPPPVHHQSGQPPPPLHDPSFGSSFRQRRYSAGAVLQMGGMMTMGMPSIQEDPEHGDNMFAPAATQPPPSMSGKRRTSHPLIHYPHGHDSMRSTSSRCSTASSSPKTSPRSSPRQAMYEQGLQFGARKVARRDVTSPLEMHALATEMSGVTVNPGQHDFVPRVPQRRSSVPALSVEGFYGQGRRPQEHSMAAHDAAIHMAQYVNNGPVPASKVPEVNLVGVEPMDSGGDDSANPGGYRMSALLSNVCDQL